MPARLNDTSVLVRDLSSDQKGLRFLVDDSSEAATGGSVETSPEQNGDDQQTILQVQKP
jgi:hypothetical protein